MLGISKGWFFTLLTAYRQDPAAFSVAYRRATPARLTAAIGAITQHDGCTQLRSPFAQEKRVPITSIDDFSRKLLFADFFPQESTLAHIQATGASIQAYGLPLRYYVDSLRVFRFVQGRDSVWRKHVLETDDVDTQWSKMMRILGVEVIYALSPQAKGKIERPYRWLQDRIVRTCALERISTAQDARPVLNEELDRYNNHQVHSTTKEIPSPQAIPYSVHSPRPSPTPALKTYSACVKQGRSTATDAFLCSSMKVPNVQLYDDVEVHLIPDMLRQVMDIRIWWNDHMVHSVTYPLQEFHVHF